MAQSQRNYSLDEYFDVENHSDLRFEYFAGQIFAMAGGSYRHNRISSNVLAAFVARLRGSPCSAVGSDMRVSTTSGLYTYPDAVIVCGEPELSRHPFDRGETLTNPTVLVEVLSESTRLYDLGEKFDHYRAVSSVMECLFVEQETITIERRWLDQKEWRSETLRDPSAVVRLIGAPVELPVAEVYEGVF